MPDWKEEFDEAVDWLRGRRSQCAASTDIEDLKSSIKLAKGRIDKVLLGGELLQGDSRVFSKLKDANRGLGDIADALEKVGDIALDIRAVNEIHNAVVILSDDNVIQQNPDGAALAFGQLFVGFGRLCHYLPSPGKEWGQFLRGAGTFFYDMRQKLDPNVRWKSQFSQIDGYVP